MKTLTSIDHCGILLLTSWQLGLKLLTTILWTSWRRELFFVHPLSLYLLSLTPRMLWKTVLKALIKSKQLATTDSPWSTKLLISSEGSQFSCTQFVFRSLPCLIPVTFMSIVPGNSFSLGFALCFVQRMRWDGPLPSSLDSLSPPAPTFLFWWVWFICKLPVSCHRQSPWLFKDDRQQPSSDIS